MNDKPFYDHYMCTSGIIYIKDILNEENKIMSYSKLNEFYCKQFDRLKYYSIVHSVPKEWKEAVNDKIIENHQFETLYEQLLECERIPHIIYNRLIDSQNLVAKQYQRATRKFDFNFRMNNLFMLFQECITVS